MQMIDFLILFTAVTIVLLSSFPSLSSIQFSSLRLPTPLYASPYLPPSLYSSSLYISPFLPLLHNRVSRVLVLNGLHAVFHSVLRMQVGFWMSRRGGCGCVFNTRLAFPPFLASASATALPFLAWPWCVSACLPVACWSFNPPVSGLKYFFSYHESCKRRKWLG